MSLALMSRMLVITATAVVLTTSLARAQITDSLPGYGPDNSGPTFSMLPDYERTRSLADIQRDAEIEQKYKETMRNRIPDKKASNDPWRKIRPAPAAAAADRYRPD